MSYADPDDELSVTPSTFPTAETTTPSPTSGGVTVTSPLPTTTPGVATTPSATPAIYPTFSPSVSPAIGISEAGVASTDENENEKKNEDDDEFWKDDSFRVSSASVGGVVLLVAGLLTYVRTMRGKTARHKASKNNVEEEAGGTIELEAK